MSTNLQDDINLLSTDALAYIGDAYFTLFCRSLVLQHHNAKPYRLNPIVTKFVNAKAQSGFLEKIMPMLNPAELDIIRRARNSPTTTKSKNFGLADYKRATSFEALVGYLYILDKTRLDVVLTKVFEGVDI